MSTVEQMAGIAEHLPFFIIHCHLRDNCAFAIERYCEWSEANEGRVMGSFRCAMKIYVMLVAVALPIGAFGPLTNAYSASARSRIVEPIPQDARITKIRAQIGEVGLHRPRSFALRTSVSQKNRINDYVQALAERFVLDIGGHSVQDYSQFKLTIESIALKVDEQNSTKTILLSAKMTDSSPTGNGQILMKSNLEIECHKDEGFGVRDCPYDPYIINELLYRLSL